MRICHCILGGTEHCRYCQNNSNYLTDWNNTQKQDKTKTVSKSERA